MDTGERSDEALVNAVATGDDLDAFRRVAEAAAAICECAVAAVHVFDGVGWSPVSTVGRGAATLSDDLAATVLAADGLCHLVAPHPSLPDGVACMLAVAARRSDGSPVAVVQVAADEMHEFADSQKAALEVFGGYLSSVLDRVGMEAELTVATAEKVAADASADDVGRLLAVAFAANPDGIVICDPGGRYVDVNPAFERMLGRARSDVLGRVPYEIMARDARGDEERIMRRLISGQLDSVVRETKYLRPDGAEVTLAVTTQLIRDGEGEPLFFFSYGHDATVSRRAEHALRAMDEAVEAIVSWDRSGTVASWNCGAERMFGWRQADAVGRPVWEMLDPEGDDLAERAEELLATESEERAQRPIELTCRGRHGVPVAVEVTVSSFPVHGEQRFSAVIRDISARRDREGALAESQRQLATLMANLPGMAYRSVNEPDRPLEFASGGARDLTGYTPGELTGEVAYGELIHPDDRQMVWDRVQGAVEADVAFEISYRITRKDGDVRWVLERGRGVRDGDRLRCIEGFITDVTDIRRAQAAQVRDTALVGLLKAVGVSAEAAETLEESLEVAAREISAMTGWESSCLVVRDDAGDLRVTDLAVDARGGTACEVSALALEAIDLRRPVISEDDAGDRSEVRGGSIAVPIVGAASVEAVLEFRFEGAAPARDALLFDVLVQVGAHLAALVDRKRTDIATAGARRREAHADERVVALEHLRTELLTAASHHLRTPLTVIVGIVKLIRDRWSQLDDETALHLLERAAVAGDRLEELIQDLTEVEAYTSGQQAVMLTDVELDNVVRRAADHVDLGGRPVTMALAPVVVRADASKLWRALVAVLDNVAAHTPSDTAVDIAVAETDEWVVVRVTDTGPGMPRDPDSAIRAFGQGLARPAHRPGLGIGLTVADTVARLHGGRLSLASGAEGGTVVELRLPRLDPSDRSRAGAGSPGEGQTSSTSFEVLAGRLTHEMGHALTRILRTARRQTDMKVAYFSVITPTEQLVVAADGDGAGFGVRAGVRVPLREAYCSRMLAGELDNIVRDTTAAPVIADLPATLGGLRSYIGVPVRLENGHVVGTLCCADSVPRPHVSDTEVATLDGLARVLGVALSTRTDDEQSLNAVTDAVMDVIRDPTLPQIVYQPIVALGTGAVVGVEGLSRFPGFDDRPVDLWFADAARVGLLQALEGKAARRALEGLGSLGPLQYVSINFSPETVTSGGLERLLANIPASQVLIELTEHAAIDDYSEIAAALEPYRARGARLAIDDVGAGFSTLRHVLALRPDVLKIDRSLVARVTDGPVESAAVAGLAALGAALGADTIAEGVEQLEQVQPLLDAGVTHIQGWLPGRPAPLPPAEPPDDLVQLLSASATRSDGAADTGPIPLGRERGEVWLVVDAFPVTGGATLGVFPTKQEAETYAAGLHRAFYPRIERWRFGDTTGSDRR